MKHHTPVIIRPTLKALAASRRVAVRRLAVEQAKLKSKESAAEVALKKRISDIDAHIAKITQPKTP